MIWYVLFVPSFIKSINASLITFAPWLPPNARTNCKFGFKPSWANFSSFCFCEKYSLFTLVGVPVVTFFAYSVAMSPPLKEDSMNIFPKKS